MKTIKLKSKKDIMKGLKLVKTKLEKHYADKFDKLILFGSVARNEQRDDSDIDILIMMNTGHQLDWKEENTIFDDVSSVMINEGLPFDMKIFDKSMLNTIWAREPFMVNVLKEGVAV